MYENPVPARSGDRDRFRFGCIRADEGLRHAPVCQAGSDAVHRDRRSPRPLHDGSARPHARGPRAWTSEACASKDGASTEIGEMTGNKSTGSGVHWGTVEGGDKYFVRYAGLRHLHKDGAWWPPSGAPGNTRAAPAHSRAHGQGNVQGQGQRRRHVDLRGRGRLVASRRQEVSGLPAGPLRRAGCFLFSQSALVK